MQFIFEEILCNIRAIDGSAISGETMRQIIAACARAIEDTQAHKDRADEEKHVDGQEREA
jgi:hypothetical protein